jgi:hypothetical protein
MKSLAQWKKGRYRMQGDRQKGLEKSPAQELVAAGREIGSRQWKWGDIEVLVKKKITKIPRLPVYSCSLEILNGIKSHWGPQSLHLRRNVGRRGASGWRGIVGRCRRVGSGGRILTIQLTAMEARVQTQRNPSFPFYCGWKCLLCNTQGLDHLCGVLSVCGTVCFGVRYHRRRCFGVFHRRRKGGGARAQ